MLWYLQGQGGGEWYPQAPEEVGSNSRIFITRRAKAFKELGSHQYQTVAWVPCPKNQDNILPSGQQDLLRPWLYLSLYVGFPGKLVGKKSASKAGDPSLIPGPGRSAGEGIGYPLQYSWAALVVQLVKSLPAMQETWIQSLGWEDPLEKGKATHSSILVWRIPWTV